MAIALEMERVHGSPGFAAIDLVGKGTEGEVYLRDFRALEASRFAVVKIGGEMIRNPDQLQRIALGIAFLQGQRLYPVIVHGGGVQITDGLEEAGIESDRIEGKRVTSLGGSLVVKTALDEVNQRLCDAIEAYGGRTIGIRNRVFGASIEDGDNLGRVGKVDRVDASQIFAATSNEKIAVVSCVGNLALSDINFLPVHLNINGDTAAVALAGALKPQKFISLTEKGAVLDAQGNWIKSLTHQEAEQMIADGSLTDGMRLKVLEGLKLHGLGVHDAVITSPAKFLLELFTDGVSTIMRSDETGPVHIPPRLRSARLI